MVGFFKYLTGGYGGKMMPKNAVEHVYHVHIMINTISRDSDDIYFLVKKKGLYISDIRGTLSFNRKKLTSGMLKSYLKSVRLFSNFVHHGLLVEKHLRISNEKMPYTFWQKRKGYISQTFKEPYLSTERS